MITEIDQNSLDIDWFFTNGEEIVFVASGGGKLPASIARLRENVELLVSYFRALPERGGVIINPALDIIIPKGSVDERYLSSFVYMAKRGLFSFDKTVLNNFSNTDYHLVATPLNPLKLDELPFYIAKILIETKVTMAIDGSLRGFNVENDFLT